LSGKWVVFQPSPVQSKSGKTSRWDVVTKGGEKFAGGVVLGVIQWWGAWRKYAFFPGDATLYEPTCLRDIAAFIDERMAQRRAGKRSDAH